MDLSIIIPVYNEEENIEKLFEEKFDAKLKEMKESIMTLLMIFLLFPWIRLTGHSTMEKILTK